MTSEKPEQYGVESNPNPQNEPTKPSVDRQADPSGASKASKPTPIDLEPFDQPNVKIARAIESEVDRPAKQSVKDLDVCPNCGASMRGSDALVCLRCGFDLKTMKMVKTLTGDDAPIKDDEAEQGPPLVRPGAGDLWLPATLAAVSGFILLICYLAGVRGLFPFLVAANPSAEISVSDRLLGLLQMIVFIGMWTACGVGALVFVAHLLGVKLVEDVADLKLAAIRMLAIVTIVRLVSVIHLGHPTLEWSLEAALEIVGFWLLSIALFRIKPRDAATLTGAAMILFVALWMIARVLVWATSTA